MQQKLNALETRKADLERLLQEVSVSAPAMRPNFAEVYHTKVADLQAASGEPGDDASALEAVRNLIAVVVLQPMRDGNGPQVELVGEITAMVDLASGQPNRPLTLDLFSSSVKLVAGMRNRRSHHSTVPI